MPIQKSYLRFYRFIWPQAHKNNYVRLEVATSGTPSKMMQKCQKDPIFFLTSGGDRHLPDTDLVIRVTSKQSLTISRPSHGQALGRSSLGRVSGYFGFELLNHVLAFKIPNLDGWASGSAQPTSRYDLENSQFCDLILGEHYFQN